ncbi:EutP/PduV family microcompartment system protein [Vibrio mangrovi]|uniref:EutP/PduV family microcompartment system protein n=1 Tax=Vibrio mangrovi TaxID=474394 RepID=A0A1Y6J048_9VIBR|nr:EutP/PduV family microcompartment system protein [Vibrio mangrovi]MDW6005169.1 EutP/PduV family microcompartment system protein [Vibrio mangrovi]SMS02621.1 Propanediol utilization protein PduV [Vibrio mangrovi]
MKRIMLIGQTLSGKTTLLQKLQGLPLDYHKTQSLACEDTSIDTPGEYLENRSLNSALFITSYDADIIGLVHSATAQQEMFSPLFASAFTKPVIGIVTKSDSPEANIQEAITHLTLAGADPIFITSSYDGDGIPALVDYLSQTELKQNRTEVKPN